MAHHIVNTDPREAPRRRSGNFFWPIVLIGVGVILLLAQAGWIAALDWWLLVDLGPVLLILAGLNLLFGRRSPLVGALMGLIAVAGLAVLLTYGPAWGLQSQVRENWPKVYLGSGSPAMVNQHFEVVAGEATAAEITLSPGAAPLQFSALADSDNLFEADTNDIREVVLTSSEGATTKIDMRHAADSAGFSWWPSFDERGWQVALNPRIPASLTIDAGSGSSRLDLSGLQITSLNVDGGSGSVRAQLPAGRLSGALDMGSGSLEMAVPAAADAEVSLAMGSGSAVMNVAPDAALDLRLINGGSGSLAVNLPIDAAVQVVVNDRGSGSVNLPGELQQVSAGDRDGLGTWETEGFSSAARRVVITIDDGGSGSISVHMD